MGRKGKKQSNKDEKENSQEGSQRDNPRESRDQQSQQYQRREPQTSQSRDSLFREPQPSHRGDHDTPRRETQTFQRRESQLPQQSHQKEMQPPQRRWQQSQKEEFQIKDQQTQRRDVQERESQASQRKDFQPRENQQKKQQRQQGQEESASPFSQSKEESFPSLQSGSDQQKLPKEAWGRGKGRGRGKGKSQIVQAEPGASNTGPTESMNQQKTPKEAWVRERKSIDTVEAEPGISRTSKETMPKEMPVQTDKNTKQIDMSQKTSTSKSMAKVTPPTTELAKLTVQTTGKFVPPKRKIATKAGSSGTPIRVLTNMMEIKFGAKFPDTVFHYNMVFDPDKPKYLFRDIFEQAISMAFPNRYPAFDGKKNAYSSRKLFEGRTFTVENVTVRNTDNIEKVYKVTFEIANIIDVRWLKNIRPGLEESEREIVALQAINTILAQAAVRNAISVGRSYFTTPPGHVLNRSYLGGGMDLWVGMFQSAVVGWKPFLNVDVAHKGFPRPQNVIDLIKILCFERPRDNANVLQNRLTANDIERNRRKINDFLKGLRVKTVVNGVTRSRQVVNELTRKIPKEDFFEGPNNARISVQTYFEKAKNYRIQYPDFPCLWIGPRTKNNHVPLEICEIEDGQAIQRKLNEAQTSSMIRSAATGTQEREDKIMRVFNAVNHNRDNCIRNEFDMNINGQFQEVDARILEPPKLLYNDRSVNVNKGVWDTSTFLKPTQAISAKGSWTILNCNERTRDADISKFSDYLRRAGRQVGMDIGEPLMPIQFIRIRETREGTVILTDLQNYFNELLKKKVLFVIVIFSDFQKCSYSVIKQVAELKVGILTQCIKSFTIERKLNDSTIKNLLQKINAKLNGTNHRFDPKSRPKCLNTPCMIVGADVTHPSPDARNIPSIAAVAASHDPNAFQYNIELRLQPPREEIILDLENIMLIQLKYFKEKTSYEPQKIVFFRDGVSEGQFRMVMERELTAIRSACKKLNQNYEPKITFLVVQKRHHIRMFPINRKDSDDKHFNVKAGTVVDTLITHPTDIDFYLVSHASIQGTARPTKYRCLWDDSDMSENEIETLTYFLCHMFTRCTRSVSYPTPTYYAHLAAFRARNLTNNVDINLNNLAAEQRLKLSIKESVLKEKPMFFV